MMFKYESHKRKHVCVKCQICGKDCPDKRSLDRHIEVNHVDQILRKKISCELCDREFNNRSYLLIHVREIHGKGEKKFNCDYCGKKYRLKHLLVNHMVVHFSLVKCKLCDKRIKPLSMKSHMEHAHTKHKPVKCEICQKEFKFKKMLESHMKVHDKKFKCIVCEKTFAKRATLLGHLERHRDKTIYKCDICGKVCSSKTTVITHKLHIHEPHKWNIKCDKCDYKTYEKRMLEGHKNTKH